MAKNTPPKRKQKLAKQNRISKFARYLLSNPKELMAAVLLLMILILGFSIWVKNTSNHHKLVAEISKQRTQLSNAERVIKHNYGLVISTFGIPEDSLTLKKCDYASSFSEFTRGDRYCYINQSFSYSVTDLTQAKQMAKNISLRIGAGSLSTGSSIAEENNTNFPIEIGASSYSKDDLNCRNGYLYYASSQDIASLGYSAVKIETLRGLHIEFVCSIRPAAAVFY